MPRNLFEVRNKTRLLNAISCTIAGFSLVYSIINLFIIEKPINILFLDNLSKYFLVCIPIIAIAFCVYFVISSKKIMLNLTKVPLLFRETKFSPENKKAFNCIQADTIIMINLFIQILFFFIQIETINTAKGIPPFSVIIPLVCVVLIAFVTFKNIFKCLKIQK